MLIDTLSPKQQAFVREYRISRNASEAYRKAGYAPKDADSAGPRLLGNVRVNDAIAEMDAGMAERLEIKAEDIVRRYEQIAFADPRKLTSHRIGACRFCHGQDGFYHWRTPREFQVKLDAARAAHKDNPDKWPTDAGGYGYNATRPPRPDCPECDGLGAPYVVFADTDAMGPAEAALFAGVKQTKDGIEYKFHDQMKALEQLAERTGVFAERDQRQASALADLLTGIQGASLPIGQKAGS